MEPSSEEDTLARGETLGRYVIRELRGRGAMGAVYAAVDPELDRRVALKVIGGALARRGVEAARERLRREAQALARLAHPNVVRVFDVGMAEDRLFLAMELVEGRDLRRWLAERPRGWVEVVDAMEQVGRGVAAAHALGLVHRDLKPENVLVGTDGRVRVGDFGLARRLGEDDEAPTTGGDAAPPLTLTATGTTLGTPVYMAPEQHEGDEAEPRSDQYAFCVTLYEALYGRRPFGPEDDEDALARAKRDGRPGLDPRGAKGRVPAALRAVVRRGLAPEPDDRFPSMAQLVDALVRVRSRAATVRGMAAITGLVLVAGIAAVATASQGPERSPCAEAGQPPDDAWSEAARDRTRERLGALTSSDDARRITEALDDRVRRWSDARRDACEDTWVRGEQSPARLDARMACSRTQWTEIAATVQLLREADEATAARADELVQGLPVAARCEGARPHAARGMADAEAATAVREALANAAALRRAARYDEAWAALSALPSHDDPSAEAAALAVMRGRVLRDRGELRRSEQTFQHALRLARAAGDAGSEAEAWLSLADAASELEHEPGRIRFQARMGMAAAHAKGGDDRLESWALTTLGSLAFVQGDDEQARVHWEEALELRRALFGEDHPLTASSLNNLGGVLYGQGDLEGAERMLRRGLEIRERVLGPEHPVVADSAANLGLVLIAAERAEEAVGLYERATNILERRLGPEHPHLVRAYDGLGQALLDAGRMEEARERFERALALAARTLPPRHPMTASILWNLAGIELERGEPLRAEEVAREAVAVVTDDSFDPQMQAEVHWVHARALEALGRWQPARAAAERALAYAIETGDDAFDRRQEIEAWLGRVPSPG